MCLMFLLPVSRMGKMESVGRVFRVHCMGNVSLRVRLVGDVNVVLFVHKSVEINQACFLCDRPMPVMGNTEEGKRFSFLICYSESECSCRFCKGKVGMTVMSHGDYTIAVFDAYNTALERRREMNHQFSMLNMDFEFLMAAFFGRSEDIHRDRVRCRRAHLDAVAGGVGGLGRRKMETGTWENAI